MNWPARNRNLLASIVPNIGTTPDELAAIIAADRVHWAPIVKAAGFAANTR
jgi:hypothetical protein